MAFDKAKLRPWLRQQPQPDRIRIRNDEDEERIISLEENLRNRWKHAEQAVIGSRAHFVECLDKKGATLRAVNLVDEEDDDSKLESTDVERQAAASMKGVAAIIDRIATRHNEAFEAGVAAASASHEALLAVVDTLTGNLNLAIANLHNASINLANVLAGKEPEEGGQNQELLVRVLAQAAGKALAPTPPDPNGKKGPT